MAQRNNGWRIIIYTLTIFVAFLGLWGALWGKIGEVSASVKAMQNTQKLVNQDIRNIRKSIGELTERLTRVEVKIQKLLEDRK